MATFLENLNRPYQGFQSATDIAQDFYPKDGNPSLDSWFFFSNMRNEDHNLSFLLHFMAMAGPANSRIMKVCFSVTDHNTKYYAANDIMIPLTSETVSVKEDILSVVTPQYSFSGNLEQISLHVHDDNCKFDATITPQGYALMNGGTGYYPLLTMKKNIQYSLPKFALTGSMTVEGKEHSVTGDCWLDRQYDYFEMQHDAKGAVHPGRWVWLGLNVKDGPAFSIGDYKTSDGINHCFASILFPDGKQATIDLDSIIETATEVFVSDKTGRRYPTNFHVVIPEFDMDLYLKADPENQEIIAASSNMHKFEGSGMLHGTIGGKPIEGSGIIELSGPWL